VSVSVGVGRKYFKKSRSREVGGIFYSCGQSMKYVILCSLLIFSSCALDVKQLHGYWQATAFFEEGQRLESALVDQVSIEFVPSGRYMFRSSARYTEAGLFRESGQHLFLTDTTQTPNKVRKIKVLYLSADSLKIKMGKNGKDRVLFLARKSAQ